MKKNKKIAWFGFLFAVLLLSVSFQSFAAGRFIRDYEIVDSNIEVYCCGVEQEGLWSIKAGKEQIRAEVKEDRMPVTVYCLVDVSGSMDDAQMDQTRRILSSISAAMSPEDNMVIGTLGNTVEAGGLLKTEEERLQAILALVQGSEDTNLYAGIVESLDELKKRLVYHRASSLLILSDGEDDQASGYTEEEAEEAVLNSGIPVFTAAILRENPSEEQIENGKLLGSFARNSTGGEHYAPLLENISPEETGSRIWNEMQKNLTLTADLSKAALDLRGETLLFTVNYEDGEIRLQDSVRIYTDELPAFDQETEAGTETQSESETEAGTETQSESETEAGTETQSESKAEAGTETQSESETEAGTEVQSESEKEVFTEGQRELESEPSGRRFLWPLLAGAAVILLILCAAIGKNRKKRRKKGCFIPGRQEERKEEEKEKISCEVRFTAIKQSGKVYSVTLQQGEIFTVGRSREAQVMLDSQDRKISGVHCRIKWEKGKLYAEDLKSTNGTFLNGIPISGKGWVHVPDGDSLRIGLYEYRVRIRNQEKRKG